MVTLLEQAKQRYNTKNVLTEDDFKLPMNDFILKIYSSCDPSTYGKAFTTKINKDNPDKLYVVPDGNDRGDLCVTYPIRNEYYKNFMITTGIIGNYMETLDFETEVKKSFIEGKISFLGNGSKNYSVRNIRIYQDFNYFLLCLVDCDNDFKPTFIIVDKEIITNGKITLSIMNGTKSSNKMNKDVGMGFAFKKDSWQHKYLLENNKLSKPHSYRECLDFIVKERERLMNEFWNWDKHLSKIEWLNELIETKEQFDIMYVKTVSIEHTRKMDMLKMVDLLIKNKWVMIDRDTWKCPEDSISCKSNNFTRNYSFDCACSHLLIELSLKNLSNPWRHKDELLVS